MPTQLLTRRELVAFTSQVRSRRVGVEVTPCCRRDSNDPLTVHVGGRFKSNLTGACEDAAPVNLRFQETRHTYATRLRANGVHECDIRDLLGHASLRMTSVYTHLLTHANLRQAD